MDLRTVLKSPIIYTSYQKLVGGYRARKKFIEDYLNIGPTDKLLDFGCGPGDILQFLPKLNYTGVDIDPIYIEKANEKYGSRGRFICSELSKINLEHEEGTFDYVIATGVLHHMTNEECTSFIAWASSLLKPNGRLLTLDGCYIPNQNKISKYLMDKDRGEYVRTPEAYKELVSKGFINVKGNIEENYFYVPYTLLIMDCLKS